MIEPILVFIAGKCFNYFDPIGTPNLMDNIVSPLASLTVWNKTGLPGEDHNWAIGELPRPQKAHMGGLWQRGAQRQLVPEIPRAHLQHGCRHPPGGAWATPPRPHAVGLMILMRRS